MDGWIPVVVRMQVKCTRCGHSGDETHEFDVPLAKPREMEKYEPGKCPECRARLQMHLKRTQTAAVGAGFRFMPDFDRHLRMSRNTSVGTRAVSTLRAMRQLFEVREGWSNVSLLMLEVFLRDYPRPLEVRPPLGRKANYREWVDPALGQWPGNAVAKSWTGCRRTGYQTFYQIRSLPTEAV